MAELGGACNSEEELRQARLNIEPELLKQWVLSGALPLASTGPRYEPGEIRDMATAALQERRSASKNSVGSDRSKTSASDRSKTSDEP